MLKDDAVRIFQEFAQAKAHCSQSRAYALNRLSWRASKKGYLLLTVPCVSDGPINGVLQCLYRAAARATLKPGDILIMDYLLQ